jgi:hypothetical protein
LNLVEPFLYRFDIEAERYFLLFGSMFDVPI